MKVAIIANSDSGLYLFRNELILELLKKNEVVLCIPNGDYCDYFKKIGCKIRITDFNRHGTNPIKELKLISTYINILKKEKPKIVFTYTIKPNIYGGMACSFLGIPYVANITGLGTAVENPGLMQKVSLVLYKFGLKNANKVFFQNTENRDFMIKKRVVKKSYDLLPGSGVNINRYTVTEYPCGDKVEFLFVSRLMKEKGIDQYLDAAKFIKAKYPYTEFHICGNMEQDYTDIINELVKNGTIIYHGTVKDMRPMYQKAACTIHPTYYPEGLSNVLLESAASGRPIITTNRSGCREVVDDGVNGYVVEEKNSQDLIDKIEMFLSKSVEERKQMGLAGRAKVEKEFNRQIVIDKYLAEMKKA